MNYPKRKHPRLKQYDYSLPGYYYVTIHSSVNSPILSKITQGIGPGEAAIHLTAAGKTVQHQLLALQKRYPSLIIDKHVIMPNHVHAIVRLTELPSGQQGATLMAAIGTFKSMATRLCNQLDNTPGRQIFQTSFYETVLRNEAAYLECWRYIDENPLKWLLDPEDL